MKGMKKDGGSVMFFFRVQCVHWRLGNFIELEIVNYLMRFQCGLAQPPLIPRFGTMGLAHRDTLDWGGIHA